jgi:hypothetical protein
MFAKSKISQSMIDAVNSVITEDKKRLINDAEMDETGFHKAAHAAKKAGQSHFEFQGKKYPATAKSTAEAIEIDEASEKVPTPTGMKVYGSSYGNSMKARRDQTKSSVDDVKEPTKKDIEKDSKLYQKTYHGTSKHYLRKDTQRYMSKVGEEVEELDEDGNCVTKPEAKKIAKKEVSHHNVTMHKGQKNTAKMEGLTFAQKLLAMYEQKTAGTDEVFTDNNIGESEMSDAQMKKREKIVMSMKKGMAGFKQRYGKNWKNVMYATATKQAMKEDSSDEWDGEQLEEATPAKNQDVADKAYLKHKPGTVKGTMTQLGRFLKGKPEIKEETIQEKNDSHTHAAHYENDKGEWSGMQLFTAKDDQDAIKQAHAKCKEGCRLSKVERHTTVKEDVEVQVDKKGGDKITTDMLSGRVAGGKTNAFKNYKVDLKTSGEEPVPVQIDKGEDTRERQKITTNPGPVDIKLDDKLTGPTPYTYFSSEHQITHEEVQVDEKVIAGTSGWKKIKGADTKGNIKDKSGAVHTPMSRAKDLARQAFKKIKTETMMGKISN